MVFDLSEFRDLGKCSMGTLLDKFDTEKDKIYVMCAYDSEFGGKYIEVKIKNIDDLFIFLWGLPGMAARDENGHSWFFGPITEPWWKSEFKERHDRFVEYLDRHKEGKTYSKKVLQAITDAKDIVSWIEGRWSELELEMKEIEEKIKSCNNEE